MLFVLFWCCEYIYIYTYIYAKVEGQYDRYLLATEAVGQGSTTYIHFISNQTACIPRAGLAVTGTAALVAFVAVGAGAAGVEEVGWQQGHPSKAMGGADASVGVSVGEGGNISYIRPVHPGPIHPFKHTKIHPLQRPPGRPPWGRRAWAGGPGAGAGG